MDTPYVEPTADVDRCAVLGGGTTVWHLAQIRENARLGSGCIVGRGAYVGPGVHIGNNVKLQNYALVYEPARLEDSVFIGPAAVLTNDLYPRSVDVTGKLKRPADVPDYALVAGVPARHIGWVGRAGQRLLADAPGRWRCPLTGELYHQHDGVLTRAAR